MSRSRSLRPGLKGVFGLFFTASVLLLISVQEAGAVLPDNLMVDIADVTGNGQPDQLVLSKWTLRGADYKVYSWSPDSGYTQVPTPQVRTYRGYVQADPDIRVNAVIMPNGKLSANFSTGRAISKQISVTVDVEGEEGNPNPPSANVVIPRVVNRVSPTPRGYIIPKYTMRKCHLGIDLANDFYTALGSIDAAVAIAEQRANDSDFFYARDMGMAWELQECVVRVGGDPGNWKTWWYSQSKAYVNSIVKYKAPGGGGSSGRFFSPTTIDHKHNMTVGTTATYSRSLGHEAAHGFGAGHYSSWQDTMSGSASALGTGTVQRMIDFSHVALEAAAPAIIYGSPLPPFAMEDAANTQVDQPVEIDLLENDYDGNGDELFVEYAQPVADRGGTVAILADGRVRYTPPAGFAGMDTFAYHVSDSTGLTNRRGYVKVYVRSEGLATHLLFDETEGLTVHDFGPYRADGTLVSGMSFDNSTTGMIGNALAWPAGSNSTASVNVPGTGDPLDGSLSVSLWVRYLEVPQSALPLICKGGADFPGRFLSPRGGWAIGHAGAGGFAFIGNLQRDLDDGSEIFDRRANMTIETDKWYHLVMTIDRANHVIRAWVNNTEYETTVKGSYVADGMIEAYYPLAIFDAQSQREQGTNTPCVIDDVRIYNKVLTADDVAELYAAEADIPAGAPSPMDASEVQMSDVSLSWMPGKPDTYRFDVYFGTDKDAVAAAKVTSPEYKGRQDAQTYDVTVQPSGSYYWRVDEVRSDGRVIGGSVWSFETSSKSSHNYRLDFGPANGVVEAGFAGVQYDVPTGVNWAMFHLTASEGGSVSMPTNGGNGDLLYDYVRNYQGWGKLILTFSEVPAGEYMLRFHPWMSIVYDVPQSAWLQKQGDSTRLCSFSRVIKSKTPYEAVVTLEAGATYEFVVQEVNNTSNAYIAGFELIDMNDTQSPSPDPMAWHVEPQPVSMQSVYMRANAAADVFGVEYYFECVNGSGHDSGWQASPEYTDTGLEANAEYSYRVMARDKSDNLNQTAYSPAAMVSLDLADGQEGLADIAVFAGQWFRTDCGFCCGADLDGDGDVDLADLRILCENWLGGVE